MLIKIWRHLLRRRKIQFGLLLFLMIISSIVEVVSIGAVVPFLGAIVSPEEIYNHQIMLPLRQFLDLRYPSDLVLPMTVIFIVSALVAGMVRLAVLYVMTKLTYAAGSDLSINIYQRTLYQKYSVHLSRNSSEIINGIISKTDAVIGGVLMPIVSIISSFILLIGILSALFFIDSTVTLITFSSFGVLYWVVIKYTRKRLHENSMTISGETTLMIKALQEGLGGIRDVLIDGSQEFYTELYRKSDLPFRRASGDNQFIANSPRYIMESLGMIVIAILAYGLAVNANNMSSIVPVLGAMALGAQKMLPVLQLSYSSFSRIKGVRASFEDVLDLLDQKIPMYVNDFPQKEIEFNEKIELNHVSYRYKRCLPYVLNMVDVTIPKGARVGVIGETGSGKSTLLDIVMGLLAPTKGDLVVDNEIINDENIRGWQEHISHVPQAVYLSDATVEENIAFGCRKDEIDSDQVKIVAQQAQISDLIESWKDGYQTVVGESGARLSGGQRQRIGIARALYRKADVLFFDEATSALDNKTEKEVMNAVRLLGRELTVFIIAHRLSTLEGCDLIMDISKKGEISFPDYKDIKYR